MVTRYSDVKGPNVSGATLVSVDEQFHAGGTAARSCCSVPRATPWGWTFGRSAVSSPSYSSGYSVQYRVHFTVQSTGYRAQSTVCIWAVGCILAELFLSLGVIRNSVWKFVNYLVYIISNLYLKAPKAKGL